MHVSTCVTLLLLKGNASVLGGSPQGSGWLLYLHEKGWQPWVQGSPSRGWGAKRRNACRLWGSLRPVPLFQALPGALLSSLLFFAFLLQPGYPLGCLWLRGTREAGSTTLTSNEMCHPHDVKRRSEAGQLPARRQAPGLPCSRLSPFALPSCALCAASSRLAAGCLRASSPHTAL